MKNIQFFFLLFLACVVVNPSFSNPTTILLIGEAGSKSEAILQWLNSNESFKATKALVGDQGFVTTEMDGYSVVWLHFIDSATVQRLAGDHMFIRSVSSYLKNGGRVFISLEAMHLLPILGLEAEPPRSEYVDATDYGYGRKLGLHSFLYHPVFERLNGGAYVWNPEEDGKVKLIGYFGNKIPNGRVVAVHWAYIRLHENMKIMLEYTIGKGKLIALGAYADLSIPNRNRIHLEAFLANCISYLDDRSEGRQLSYWNYDPISIHETEMTARNITYKTPAAWNLDQYSLRKRFPSASGNYFDLAGRRMLVAGFERGGIDEVWTHPFMAFRAIETGIQFDYADSIYWFNQQQPEIEIRPEALIRTYRFPRAYVTEVITVSPSKPVMVVHYEYRGVYKARLISRLKSNLRLMWPYSEHVFHEMKYCWNGKDNLLTLADGSTTFVALAGANRQPVEYKLGYPVENKIIPFADAEISTFELAGEFVFQLNMNDNLDIFYSGSNEGLAKTSDYYRQATQNPEGVLTEAYNHHRDLLSRNLMITTPDSIFNDGFRWIMATTDRFFVETPGLGSSLVAGYSTTRTGWDGGHAVNGRPGYGWYFGRDGQWSGLAFCDYGEHEKVKQVLDTYRRFQDLSGKIYHEMSTSGVIHYDASDATPLYLVLAAHYLRHSGDTAYIRALWPSLMKALEFCYTTDTDGDGLIESTGIGHGWVEGGRLYTAHTEIYLAACWAQALRSMAYMARALKMVPLSIDLEKQARFIQEIINSDFWNEQTLFLNFSKLRDGSFNSERTVLPAVALYWNLVEPHKGQLVADALAGSEFSSDWGVRILSEQSLLFNPRGYHYGSVWPLFTGWAALAGYHYGNALQGFAHIMNNLLIYKDFAYGCVEEVLNGEVYRPGGVCPHQCWSQTMVLQPVIEGMLGYLPDAPNNRITLSPVFPFHWNSVEVKNLKVADILIDWLFVKTDGKAEYIFECNNSASQLAIDFKPAFPPGTTIKGVILNGKHIKFQQKKERQHIRLVTSFILGPAVHLEILVEEGAGVLPAIAHPVSNEVSSGLRILSAYTEDELYQIVVQGRPRNSYTLQVYTPTGNIMVTGATLTGWKRGVADLLVQFDIGNGLYQEKKITIQTAKP